MTAETGENGGIGDAAKSQLPPCRWQNSDGFILAALFLVALFAFVCGLGSFGILDPSDGYYSEGAREMFESGNWLTPHLNYAWFFDKPIMNYWLIALSYKIFGVSEFASRIPASVCGALLVPALYLFSRQFCSRRAALFAALALLSSPMWLILGHMSLTDMPLSFFIWIALGSFFLALERQRTQLVWLAYLSIGCGLLTKGPLALFLVGMNLGLYLLLKRPSLSQLWAIVLRLKVIPGLLLSLAIAAPWYCLVNAETHGAFVQEFFFNQNINRAMGTVDHKAGPFYYLPAILGAAFPWTLFLLAFARAWAGPWLDFVRRRRNGSLSEKAITFGVTAAFATLIFFSALPTKLVTYLLPVIPALALCTGITLDKVFRLPGQAIKLPLMSIAALIAVIALASAAFVFASLFAPLSPLFAFKYGHILERFLQAGDQPVRVVILAALVAYTVGASLLFSLAFLGKKAYACNSFLVLVVASSVIAVPAAIVLAYQEKCRDMQSLVEYAREHHLSPLMLGRRTPSASFYMHARIRFLASADDLNALLKEKSAGASTDCFLIHLSDYTNIEKAGRKLTVLQRKGDWILGCNEQI